MNRGADVVRYFFTGISYDEDHGKYWVDLKRLAHFARYFGKLPDKFGEKEVKKYFLHLTRGKHTTYGVLKMTHCALKFIYTVTLGRPWEFDG